MADPNEGTLVRDVLEPERTDEQTHNPRQEEEQKNIKNESEVRSSINRSRSDDSLKN